LAKIRVYLDNCCFNRPFDNQNDKKIKLETEAKIAIQDLIKEGKIELAWSYILDFENSKNPDTERRNAIYLWKKICIVDVVESKDIITQANDFRNAGFSFYDSLHLACAIKAQCDYFFTTDRKILNKQAFVSNLVLLNPVMYLIEKE